MMEFDHIVGSDWRRVIESRKWRRVAPFRPLGHSGVLVRPDDRSNDSPGLFDTKLRHREGIGRRDVSSEHKVVDDNSRRYKMYGNRSIVVSRT